MVLSIESVSWLSHLWKVLPKKPILIVTLLAFLWKFLPEGAKERIIENLWKRMLKILKKDTFSKIKMKIRSRYISESTIEDIFGDTHEIDKIFVNVAVLKREDVEKLERGMQREKRKTLWDMEELRRWSFPRFGMFEEIYATLEPVELEEIVRLAEKNGKVKGLILGGAGIGKSTLCRYVCRKWVQGELWNEFELVVLLEARKWNGGIVPSIVNSYCNKEEAETYMNAKKELLAELKRRGVLLMIDGLDEVDEKRREEIKEELTKADISYLITSRPHGTEGGLVFHQRFENIGFRDEDIEKYIRRYFEEKEKKGEVKKGEKLIEFIKENSIAFAVSHIPVMLEIMCHLWREDALNAPFTVTELYDRAAKLIVKKNMKKRLGINKYEGKDFTRKLESFCDAYSSVAHATFKKEEILIPRERVEEAISNSECSIKELLNLGLIRESSYAGEEYYYFHHLTIQEFLTARYIAKSYTKEKLVEFIREEKFSPRYRRVLLFLVGLFNKDEEKLNLLFSTLKDEPRDLAGIYLLTTTLRMLGEVRELNVLKAVNVEEIVEEAWSKINNRHVIEALKLTHPEIRERMINSMIEFVERYKSANNSVERTKIINYFIWILGLLGKGHKRISNVLMNILRDRDKNHLYGVYRVTSARAFGELGMKSEMIINALLDILTDIREDVFVREAAAQALGNLRVKEDKVIDALIDVVKYSTDTDLLETSIESLTKLNSNDEKIINALLNIAKNKEEFWISRSLCIRALGAIKPKDKRVVETLINILSDAEEDVIICEKWKVNYEDLEIYFYARSSAAIALAEFDADNRRIIDIMIKILENKYENHINDIYEKLYSNDLDLCYGSCNENLRLAVAKALGKLTVNDERIVNSLLNIVKNRYESSHVRIATMNALINFLKRDNINYNDIINIFIEIIRDTDKDTRIKEYAVISLVDIGVETDKIIEIIYHLIENEIENINIRLSAIRALRKLQSLGKLKVLDERTKNILIKLLMERNIQIKRESAITLAKFGIIDRNVVNILSTVTYYYIEEHDLVSRTGLSFLHFDTLLSALRDIKDGRIYEAILDKARWENIPVFKRGNKLCAIENGREVCKEVEWGNLSDSSTTI